MLTSFSSCCQRAMLEHLLFYLQHLLISPCSISHVPFECASRQMPEDMCGVRSYRNCQISTLSFKKTKSKLLCKTLHLSKIVYMLLPSSFSFLFSFFIFFLSRTRRNHLIWCENTMSQKPDCQQFPWGVLGSFNQPLIFGSYRCVMRRGAPETATGLHCSVREASLSPRAGKGEHLLFPLEISALGKNEEVSREVLLLNTNLVGRCHGWFLVSTMALAKKKCHKYSLAVHTPSGCP